MKGYPLCFRIHGRGGVCDEAPRHQRELVFEHRVPNNVAYSVTYIILGYLVFNGGGVSE